MTNDSPSAANPGDDEAVETVVPTDASLPEDQPVEMTAGQLAETKQYGRRQLTCRLLDAALDVAFLAVWAFVAARPIDACLVESFSLESVWLRLAVFFVLTAVAGMLVTLPLAYYRGHLLEHRYRLSRQTVGRWLRRYLLRQALVAAFGLAMVEALYGIVWLAGSFWWLAAAAGFFVVGVVIGQLAPVLLMPLFYRIERIEDESLVARFDRLAKGTGLSIEGVYRMEMSVETTKANAMLTGLGPTRRVLLGDTLLDSLTEEEIEVVLAHEIGHHVYRHIPQLVLFGLVYGLLGFYLCDRVLAWHLGEALNYAALPVIALPLLMLTINVLSLLLEPLQNAIKRRFERQCDRYALDRTGLTEAYISAFTKLARRNKSDPAPPRLEVLLFYDHPPVAERIAMAKEG